jgi:glutaredoxin
VPFTYIDVTKKKADLAQMLRYSKGKREVPVIVEQDRVTIGFGGS